MNSATSVVPESWQLAYVPRKIAHHGGHSGYDILFNQMRLTPAASPFWQGLADRLPGGLAWRLWRLRPQATQQQGLRAEVGAIPWTARGRRRLCHFIYGEDTFFYTPLWKSAGNRCVATFHYPPQRLIERVNPAVLQALDAVVMVGENQREYFERFLPPQRLHYLPHHVDTGFFHPDPQPQAGDRPRLLCVGQLLRDFEVLIKVHRRVRQHWPDLLTQVLAPRQLLPEAVLAEPGVEVLSGVDDEALRTLYRSASVGLQPLRDATANNALLEMMACGLPVVASGVGGLQHYAAGSAAHLVPAGDAEAMTALVLDLLGDAARRQAEGRLNRQHAERHFSLAVCADRMRTLYRGLADAA